MTAPQMSGTQVALVNQVGGTAEWPQDRSGGRMSTLVLKRGDTQPAFYARLTYTDAGGNDASLDMTGAVVRVKAKGNNPGMPVIDRIAYGDATGNVIMYWQPADTAVPGLYRAEVEVTWPDTSRVTFPPDGYLVVAIEPDLG